LYYNFDAQTQKYVPYNQNSQPQEMKSETEKKIKKHPKKKIKKQSKKKLKKILQNHLIPSLERK